MKTKHYVHLILITFVLLAVVPYSFAQDTPPEYTVRVIYFLPNDREADPDIDNKLDTLIKDVQQFYADEMERHGFGRKTFRLETDALGQTVWHDIKGKFSNVHYKPNKSPDYTVNAAAPEINEQFDLSEHYVNLILYDMGKIDDGVGGVGGQANGKTASVTLYDFDKRPEAHYFRAFTVIAHELGHAFGLPHDFRDRHYIMSYGASTLPKKLSFCNAEWLDVHRCFNTTNNTFTDLPIIEMLEPSFVSSPNTIRLRFEITHPVKLHQAQFLTNSHSWGPGVNPLLSDCKSLNQNIETIEFITTALTIGSENVHLKVIDAYGNYGSYAFPIDMTVLLPDSDPILIPDTNLAAVLREALGLAHSSPITQLDMVRLERLNATEKQIRNLTGIQHATNLENFNLSSNQISDITPLAELAKLNVLILSQNNISDVSPVEGLTRLYSLWLGSNQISDVTPIAKLTGLAHLQLSFNEIADITPLKGLTHLEELYLAHTQISDITPLAEFSKLNTLFLTSNKISDITPLAQLTRLGELSIHFTQVSDITPLKELKSLYTLSLGVNQMTDRKPLDITPLKELTSLVKLYLGANNIHDVSPLESLVNLRDLYLVGNPIKNRKPLLELLKKNPDVKIYLKGDDPLPVTLSHFRAELTDTGVILNWTTESELDNAGFYIYRSETKDGEFQVVNPTMIEGNGTTGERTEYKWMDTTVQANTVYYYQIEDVSHAGVRKRLATVRVRGLVSAKGKLTTMWVNMKTVN